MHVLKQYLDNEGIKHKDFATAIKLSRKQLSLIVNFKSYPSVDAARRIVEATKGKVTFNALFQSRQSA